MKEIFNKYKLELEDFELEKFDKFLEIFMEKNSHINLSAIRDKDWIIEKHFIDSIMLSIFVELEWKVADMGTGWWFPLIPLAIINSEVQFTGIDSVGKKLKAIDGFVDELWLNNVTTLNWRAEEIGKDLKHRETFDFVVSRATAFFPTLLEYVIPLLKVNGVFAAYKLNDKEELKAARKALHKLGAKIVKINNYKLDEQERTIVLIQKIAKTHEKYPRKIWVPQLSPLK